VVCELPGFILICFVKRFQGKGEAPPKFGLALWILILSNSREGLQ